MDDYRCGFAKSKQRLNIRPNQHQRSGTHISRKATEPYQKRKAVSPREQSRRQLRTTTIRVRISKTSRRRSRSAPAKNRKSSNRHRRVAEKKQQFASIHRNGIALRSTGLLRKEGPQIKQECPPGYQKGVSAEGLVQIGASGAKDQGGRLPDAHHHQPLLLRPVQLVLHPEESQEEDETSAGPRGRRGGRPERAGVQVLRLLQADEVHLDHGDTEVSLHDATVQEEKSAAYQTVQVRRC